MESEKILMALVWQVLKTKECESRCDYWMRHSNEKLAEVKKLQAEIDDLKNMIDRYNINAQESICKDGEKK